MRIRIGFSDMHMHFSHRRNQRHCRTAGLGSLEARSCASLWRQAGPRFSGNTRSYFHNRFPINYKVACTRLFSIWPYDNSTTHPQSLPTLTEPSQSWLRCEIRKMLLLHQAGSVKIGEVVRYTVTYTPAHDRILPSPSHLHLKIKNTSAIALRAAFVHGPYTLYAAAYPSNYQPNEKVDNPRRDGVPEFEPNLKAGGTFSTKLAVPEDVRQDAGNSNRHGRSFGQDGEAKSVSWIIEVSSQVIFSNSAAVHYEILLGRDEKSLSMGFGSSMTGGTAPAPGQVSDHQQSQGAMDGHHSAQSKGVYSKALKLRVDDTASLWNIPKMPEWDDAGKQRAAAKNQDAPVENATDKKDDSADDGHKRKRQQKVHLVVLTHGLHANLGADMMYLKESIDATAKQAKITAKERRAKRWEEEHQKAAEAGESHSEHHDGERKAEDGDTGHPKEQREGTTDEVDDDEEVIVRGFSGNAVRTERGIKYLGKRLAKYVLQMTYPDQPYRPITKKSAAESLSHALKPEQPNPEDEGPETHRHSTIHKEPYHDRKLAYKITSISFIAHSLGGLVQTYAVAYIQKHSPKFFDTIKPINFIALASPFLGLSNENPLYVKFALDFGLVGRTGQDLGLTWRAPTIARSGWGAIVGGIGQEAHKKIDGQTAPESKPLLRILPTGPAHIVLKKFRNRTVYSNVVNDGIVPLRTSCLLFLDWQGLGRVEKARRENGLVGTMATWGWGEITGANSSPGPRHNPELDGEDSDVDETGANTPTRQGHGGDVPQPSADAYDDDDTRSLKSVKSLKERPQSTGSSFGNRSDVGSPTSGTANNGGALDSIFSFFRPNKPSSKSHNHQPKPKKIYQRSQTIKISAASTPTTPTTATHDSSLNSYARVTAGDSDQEDQGQLSAPPKTTFFESAGDVLKPPLPPVEFLIDPSSRPRTIFHDRVYHPEDIPPPPMKKRTTSGLLRRRSYSGVTSNTSGSGSSDSPFPHNVNHEDSGLSARDYDDTEHTNPDKDPREVIDGSAMKVEEKIARAYHRDLSWRKVLVRLEPDAHNNMIVRRMFANAYGWPVIKHLCDTHFSDAAVANTRDEDEGNQERAKASDEAPNADGGEMKDDERDEEGTKPVKMLSKSDRIDSETREATDEVPALDPRPHPGSLGKALASASSGRRPYYSGPDSATWSDRDWADSADESEDFDGPQEPRISSDDEGKSKKAAGWNWTEAIAGKGATSPKGTAKEEINDFLGKPVYLGKPPALRKKSDAQLKSDAAVASILSGEAAGMGIGLGGLESEADTGVMETVVRRSSQGKKRAEV